MYVLNLISTYIWPVVQLIPVYQFRPCIFLLPLFIPIFLGDVYNYNLSFPYSPWQRWSCWVQYLFFFLGSNLCSVPSTMRPICRSTLLPSSRNLYSLLAPCLPCPYRFSRHQWLLTPVLVVFFRHVFTFLHRG